METSEILETYNGANDIPDSRDFTLEEYLGVEPNTQDLPRTKILDKAENLNQLRSNSCTVTGGLNVSNETHTQFNQSYSIRTDWEKVWERAIAKGASPSNGWLLTSALAHLKDEGIIGGYIKIGQNGEAVIPKIKAMICENKAVYTGVPVANWKETLRTHYFTLTKATLAGHAFDITGYDDDYHCQDGTKGAFLVGNSWGKDGYFWFPYSETRHLFSQYIMLLDADNARLQELKSRRKNIYLQKAFEKKIWNEERPADMATAFEIRAMINRALGLPDNYKFFRKHFALMCEDKILRGKMKLWNEERPYELASDEEVAIMFTRAVTRNSELNVLVLTREQVAEVIGRDFM